MTHHAESALVDSEPINYSFGLKQLGTERTQVRMTTLALATSVSLLDYHDSLPALCTASCSALRIQPRAIHNEVIVPLRSSTQPKLCLPAASGLFPFLRLCSSL